MPQKVISFFTMYKTLKVLRYDDRFVGTKIKDKSKGRCYSIKDALRQFESILVNRTYDTWLNRTSTSDKSIRKKYKV